MLPSPNDPFETINDQIQICCNNLMNIKRCLRNALRLYFSQMTAAVEVQADCGEQLNFNELDYNIVSY